MRCSMQQGLRRAGARVQRNRLRRRLLPALPAPPQAGPSVRPQGPSQPSQQSAPPDVGFPHAGALVLCDADLRGSNTQHSGAVGQVQRWGSAQGGRAVAGRRCWPQRAVTRQDQPRVCLLVAGRRYGAATSRSSILCSPSEPCSLSASITHVWAGLSPGPRPLLAARRGPHERRRRRESRRVRRRRRCRCAAVLAVPPRCHRSRGSCWRPHQRRGPLQRESTQAALLGSPRTRPLARRARTPGLGGLCGRAWACRNGRWGWAGSGLRVASPWRAHLLALPCVA